jgi:GT2 family glycosyltransferase
VTAEPRVSIIIVSHNTRDDTLRCLASIRAHAPDASETLLCDNASDDGTVAAVGQLYPRVRVVELGANEGFGAANNRGLQEARARVALLLNSDAELRPGALATLLDRLEREPRLGIIGPRIVYPDGGAQLSFGPALTPQAEWRQRRLVRGERRRDPRILEEIEALTRVECQPDWVSGACLLARLDVLAAVGFFDERFFLYEEDADLCLRVRRAGWGVLFEPRAEVVHHVGRSMARAPGRSRLEYHRSHLLYYTKHNGWPLATLLRALLLLRALGGLPASGPDGRREAFGLLRVALGGCTKSKGRG